MEYIDKIVDFEYCKKCKYEENAESEEPCHDCLNNPTNTYSHRPVHFEWEPKKSKKSKKVNKKK